jgi:hypothetical protein
MNEYYIDTNDVRKTSDPLPEPVSAEKLANLIPGCYVKVFDRDTPYWVEITQVAGSELTGEVRMIADNAIATASQIDPGDEIAFGKENVFETGCDHLCYC